MFRCIIISAFLTFILLGCKEENIPKPKAQLRLDYPKSEYGRFDTKNFGFNMNELAKVKIQGENSLTLDYPTLKGSIFITYKKVENNLEKLMIDAQKLSYEHASKADGIRPSEFVNLENKVYGTFYEVRGNTASQAQFYVTDSTEHFVTGSLYFKTRPNYDSIYPAAAYLQNDIRAIMETLRWED
jgi:gliding motility-associated lipoprotein GldD